MICGNDFDRGAFQPLAYQTIVHMHIINLSDSNRGRGAIVEMKAVDTHSLANADEIISSIYIVDGSPKQSGETKKVSTK
jgi:hypothetical protein